MLTIKVSHQIELNVFDLPSIILKQIRKDLTLANPEYLQAVKYNKDTRGKPQTIELYRISDDLMILPRGYGGRLIKYLQKTETQYRMQNERLTLPPVNFNSSIQLRDYQQAAVDKLVMWRQGGVVAPCGSGKTMIMLEAMARIQQPALWITHTKELVDQVIKRAQAAFGIEKSEIGVIGDGSASIGPRLTVALTQTLSRMELSSITHRFGALFIDEAHHLAAKTFFHPIGQFPALYRIWVSATPERADGLTDMVYFAAGPIVHAISQADVPTIIPRLEVIETDYQCYEDDYVRIISDLILDEARNRLIAETIIREAPGNYSLVLSDRVEHLEVLKRTLEQALPSMRIDILTGSMKKREREAVMQRADERKVDIILATQLAREGLDIKHLNRLFLATPKRAAAAVQQEVGRVMRPEEGKIDAVVFDFWDVLQPILKAQFYKRREVYRQIGMEGDHPAMRKRA